MEITDVKIFKAKKRGPVLAYATVILDNSFIIRRVTLIEKEGKKYISMPASRTREGRFRDICHPINSDTRNELTEIIFKAYDDFIETEE